MGRKKQVQAEQQPTLFELNALTAEYYAPQSAGIRINMPSKPFEWERPWLTDDGYVWIYVGYGEWDLFAKHSLKARQTLEYLQAHELVRENERRRLNDLQALIRFRADHLIEQLNTRTPGLQGFAVRLDRMISLEDDMLDGTIHQKITANWQGLPLSESVPIENVVPTQDFVFKKHIVKHIKRVAYDRLSWHEPGEDNKGLPVGIRFEDTGDKIYLTNGHHRWYAAKLLGLTRISVLVDRVEKPLALCLVEDEEDDFIDDEPDEDEMADVLERLLVAI